MIPAPALNPSESRPLLLGHRGAKLHAPENTLEAFHLALQHGCDGFEFDVRRTADGKAVVCHDPHVQGMDVAHNTFASLRNRFKLPGLEEVMAAFAGKAYLDIELKVQGLERLTLDLLKKHPPRHGHMVSSFSPEVLLGLRALDITVPLGYISDERNKTVLWKSLPVQFAVLHSSLVTPQLVDEVHAAGRKVVIWTVNDAQQMQQWNHAGVDGIISDDTATLGSLPRAKAQRSGVV
jgi:glycerophosphoryl diester phosphodiesterase